MARKSYKFKNKFNKISYYIISLCILLKRYIQTHPNYVIGVIVGDHISSKQYVILENSPTRKLCSSDCHFLPFIGGHVQ